MQKLFLFCLLCFLLISNCFSQSLAINTDGSTANASSILDVKSNVRGMLIPRMSKVEKNAIISPATGLIIFQNSPDSIGLYYYNSSSWIWMPGVDQLNALSWRLIGNSGTNSSTQFMGTTDAQDLVFKTSGSSASNERLRIIGSGGNPGQVVVNNNGIFAGDVFSVFANNTTSSSAGSTNNLIGNFAINGYSSGSGTSVYGDLNGGASTGGAAIWGNTYGTATTASSTSQGVWGTNSTAPAGSGVTAAIAAGVRGDASGAAGTAITMGVLGTNTATTGTAYGVYGQTSSPSGIGVLGINLDVSATAAHGIQGQTAAVGTAAGLRGFNTAATITSAQNGFGVRGSANGVPSGTGFVMGVRGDVNSATGATYGVYGQSSSASGFGVDGYNTNGAGTGLFAIGNNVAGTFLGSGSGAAINGSNIGTFSIAKTAANGIGVVGIGNNLTGSIMTPASGAGIAGTGTQFGVMGFATTTVNTNGTNNSGANGAAASAGGYFEIANAGVPQSWAYIGVRDNTAVNRKIIGNGTVNTIVKDLNNKLVALSAPETPENLFQDYGQSKLVHGRVHIAIDPVFAKNIAVNDQHPLRVFVQLEGDCKGVFVTNKTADGFDVVELDGGFSNTAFSYSLTANRADETNPDGTIARYSNERFPAAPGPQLKTIIETKESLSTEILNANPDFPVTNLPIVTKIPSKHSNVTDIPTVNTEESNIKSTNRLKRKPTMCKNRN